MTRAGEYTLCTEEDAGWRSPRRTPQAVNSFSILFPWILALALPPQGPF
jgi:hypothetical protein